MAKGQNEKAKLSLDARTLRALQALAKKETHGDVEALIRQMAVRAEKLAAADALFRKLRLPTLDAHDLARIEAQWLGEKAVKRKAKRNAA